MTTMIPFFDLFRLLFISISVSILCYVDYLAGSITIIGTLAYCDLNSILFSDGRDWAKATGLVLSGASSGMEGGESWSG